MQVKEGRFMQQPILEQAVTILRQQEIPLMQKDGIWIATVKNQEQGIQAAKAVLDTLVDPRTVLFLSGGTTPKPLYEQLAKEGTAPGAVAEVDERYGPLGHSTSNQLMIEQTGLRAYLAQHGIPYSGILQDGLTLEQTADAYNKVVEGLLRRYGRSIAVLGIGDDGHTSGIAPNRPGLSADKAGFTNPIFSQKDRLVSAFDDTTGSFGKRVTTTFKALGEMTLLMPLVFGEKKQTALQKIFTKGSVEEIPARFYLRPSIASKTLFITDQKV